MLQRLQDRISTHWFHSRFWISTGLAASLLALACATAEPPPSVPPAATGTPEDRAAAILSRAIQFETVNPPGDERPLAQYFADLLAAAGIEAQVVATPSEQSSVGRAAVWGRLRGSGERRPIILLSHLDVVPATAADWDHDPFAGTRVGDSVVGRGALDAKGVSVVHLLTTLTLAERGIRLKRDVIFLGTPDEEGGGLDGAGYLTAARRDLLMNAEYLLTEGGGILLRGQSEAPLWRIGVVEKSPCWLRLVAPGSPGHSSVPPRDAAVPRLIHALERLSGFESEIHVVPEVARMYGSLVPLAAPQDAAGYADLEHALLSDPDFRRRFMTLRFQAALVNNTLAVTVLEGGPRTNVLPAQAVAHVDARLLPGESCEDFTHVVRELVADPGIRVEPILSFRARSSPTDTALYRAIETVAAEASPPGKIIPTVTIGFTDAHYFRDVGITSYGFTPRALAREDGKGVHGQNERTSLRSITEAVARMLAILQELDRTD